MRTVSYTALRNSILRGLTIDPAGSNSAQLLGNIASIVTLVTDYAWHWCEGGWPELRNAASRAAVANVISLDRAASIDPIAQVLGVFERHPWTSKNPGPIPFTVASGGITLADDYSATESVYVAYLKPAPQFTATAWVTATAYIVGDIVLQDNECYECITAHTSGTFATDLAATKWVIQNIPAFLSKALITGSLAIYRDQNGQPVWSAETEAAMIRQLDTIVGRYDFSRTGGAARMTSSGIV